MLASHPPIWLIIVGFICALGPLVFFHELGHYLVARLFGISAETFSIGFGRELVGWTDRQGTRWKVAWLPLGGYVKFVGDMTPASEPGEAESIPEELRGRAFQLRPVWQRFLVVLAGPMANFVLAILIYAGIFSLVSAPSTNMIGGLEANSAAATAGLHSGERIVAVDGRQTRTLDDVRLLVERRPGQTVQLKLMRAGAIRVVPVNIGREELVDDSGKKLTIGKLGVSAAPVSVFAAMGLATEQTGLEIRMLVDGLGQIFAGRVSPKELGGPITIARAAGSGAQMGVLPFIALVAFLSINLGFINLLPVPMLDGGHLFFYVIEASRRRPLSANALDYAFRGGLAFIFLLMVFVTINDLGRAGLWNGLQRLIG